MITSRRLIVSIALMGLFASAQASAVVTAQDATPAATTPAATPMADRHGLVGSWRVTAAPAQGPPELVLGTFAADGSAVTAAPRVLPAPGGADGVVYTSSGHGAWEASGPDTAILTFIVLLADEQGNVVGTNTVRANIILGADARTFSGEFVWTIADPSGTTLVTIPGTVEATRIVAEAPEMPTSGTPAVATPST